VMKNLGSKASNYLKTMGKKVTETKDDILWAYIDKRKVDGLEARRPFERTWLLNMAFLSGKQNVFFNSTAHSVQTLDPVRGRIRMMDNQILPKVRRQIADFIKSDPTMSVVPSTTEDEDIQAAKAGDKFLKSFWQSNRMKKKVRLLGGWNFSTGNAFMDHSWNSKLGPIEINQQTGVAEYAGDVDVGILSPLEVVVPFVPGVDSELHEFPWLIKQRWKSLEYIKERFEKGKLVVEESAPSALHNVDFIFKNQGVGNNKFKGAMLVEYFQKPDKVFKKGLYAIGANGIILETSDYPYDRYNLEQFKDIDVPGGFWGKATMEDAIPLQKTWNQTLSDIQEFNRTMGKGKFLIPEGSRFKIEFDNVTGQHVYYKPVMGHKPELMTLKGLPTSFTLILQTTMQSLNGLFSQHEVTQGTNKSDIRSGEMLSILREQDSHGNIPTHQIFEESLENLMSGVLKRVQKGYTSPRMIEIVGRDNEVEALSFSATDLRGNTNVTVKKQSSLPDSRIAREAIVLDRFEKGLYGDIRDPEIRRQVMLMLDDAVVKNIYATEKKDEAVAQWENRLIVQGVKVPINSYDNPMIHLRDHTNFQKSLDYQKLKFNNPKGFIEAETRFLEHNIAHQGFAKEQVNRQIQQQTMINEGGGQK